MARLTARFAGLLSGASAKDDDGPAYRPLEPLAKRGKLWRRKIEDPRRRAIYDRAMASVDRRAYRAIQDKYRKQILRDEERGTSKYIDLAPWFMIHSEIAMQLDLDKRPPCTILDIGAGGGQFLAIAKSLGHEGVALDQPEPELYRDLLALFGIPRIDGQISLGQPLPSAVGRYDLIAINGQIFDVHRPGESRWGLAPWLSLLEYLAENHLNAAGTVYIGLNRSSGPTYTEQYLQPLLDIADKHGRIIDRKRARMVFRLEKLLTFPEDDYEKWSAPRH